MEHNNPSPIPSHLHHLPSCSHIVLATVLRYTLLSLTAYITDIYYENLRVKQSKNHASFRGLRSKRGIVFLPGASCMMFTAKINTGSHFRAPMSANTQPRITCHAKWSTRQRRRSILRVRPLIANYSYGMGYPQVPYTHRSRQRSIWTTGLRSKRTRPF